MRLLGLIGGMSWESTAIYYRHLNELVRERLGGLHSARLLLWSVDFAEIAELQHDGRWEEAAARLADVATRLEAAGAEAIILCTNTMHKLADELQASVAIPLLHIADAAGAAIRAAGFSRPALLATRFTMEQVFYAGRLRERFGLNTLVPDADGRTEVHRIIYEELCHGIVADPSRRAALRCIDRLRDQGADCVILGCTELTMLLGPGDVNLTLFDTTRLHAEAAVAFTLAPIGSPSRPS